MPRARRTASRACVERGGHDLQRLPPFTAAGALRRAVHELPSRSERGGYRAHGARASRQRSRRSGRRERPVRSRHGAGDDPGRRRARTRPRSAEREAGGGETCHDVPALGERHPGAEARLPRLGGLATRGGRRPSYDPETRAARGPTATKARAVAPAPRWADGPEASTCLVVPRLAASSSAHPERCVRQRGLSRREDRRPDDDRRRAPSPRRRRPRFRAPQPLVRLGRSRSTRRGRVGGSSSSPKQVAARAALGVRLVLAPVFVAAARARRAIGARRRVGRMAGAAGGVTSGRVQSGEGARGVA